MDSGQGVPSQEELKAFIEQYRERLQQCYLKGGELHSEEICQLSAELDILIVALMKAAKETDKHTPLAISEGSI